MELETFIKETISSIAKATKSLQDELQDIGVLINPPTNGADRETTVPDDNRYHHRPVRDVEFDVAVTASSSGSGKAGASAKLYIVNVELGGGASTASETVSRVKFKIPLALSPTMHEAKNYSAAERKWKRPE